MASEAVKKILAAESESDKRIAEAKKRREEIINDAYGKSSLAIQKKISEANVDSEKIGNDYDKRLQEYSEKAEAECDKQLAELRSRAQKNMDKAVDAVIERFF